MNAKTFICAGLIYGLFFPVSSYAITEVELGKMLLGSGYEQINQSYLQKNNAVPAGSNSVAGKVGYHPGIDYRARTSRDTYSPVNGVVESTSSNSRDVDPGKDPFGTIVVKINGSETRFMFMHMSSSFVSVGTKVSIGCVVGRTGERGILGVPHLHVEARDGKRNAALYFGSESNYGVNKNPATLVPKFIPVMATKACG